MFRKVLIVGMGSAGRRYLKIVKELGVERVDVLRSGKSTIKDDIIPAPDNIYFDSTECFQNAYDLVLVCTPSSLHYEYIMQGIESGANILSEKPVSDNMDDLFKIKDAAESKGVKVGVCHNLRYHPALINLKMNYESGLFGEAICSSVHFCAYLPDWHPWEDYKISYAAKKDLGGGSALTHIHELDYLNWIFGKPVKFNGIKARKSFIGTDVDECSIINVEYESGMISQLLLTLNTKPPKRDFFVYFTKGRVEIDLVSGNTEYFSSDGVVLNLEKELKDFNFENTYRDMILDFYRMVNDGRSNVCTIEDAIESTKIVTGI